MTTSSTSHTRYSWKKPASSWKKPMVKFVVSLVLLKRKKKKTAPPFNFMFLIKLWAFYNEGRGLFIGVDIYIYIYIFSSLGDLGMFLQPIPPSKQKGGNHFWHHP